MILLKSKHEECKIFDKNFIHNSLQSTCAIDVDLNFICLNRLALGLIPCNKSQYTIYY